MYSLGEKMGMVQKFKGALAAFFVMAISLNGWAWGTKGHQTIETVAVQLLPDSSFTQLLKTNIRGVQYLAMTPDLTWKHGNNPHPLEGEAHFFQINAFLLDQGALNPNLDFYVDKMGSALVIKNGTAPWRVQQLSLLLVQALKSPSLNPLQILQIAATLGHYVGDVGNPLHVSADYDGVGVGQKGLHSFFESDTVNLMDTQKLLSAVNSTTLQILAKMPSNLTPLDGSFNLARSGVQQGDILLGEAKSLGLTPALQQQIQPMIVSTLSMSTAVLTKLWLEAYQMAGSPNIPVTDLGRVPDPDWIPVNYIKGVSP
jgi:hypothetical protein